jgi:hypothetical protein
MAWTPTGGSLATMKTPTGEVDLREALWVVVLARVVVYQRGGDGGNELGSEAFDSRRKATRLDYL